MSSMRSFVVLAYLLTWALLAPWFYLFNVVYHGEPPGWFWFLAPLAFVGGWGPSVAALIVTARDEGRAAMRRLLASLVAWRVSARWYLVALLLPPLATALSILIVDRGTVRLGQLDLGAIAAKLALIYAIALPFGPLGEELGWRGYALPRLLSRSGPWGASLILGTLWTFWHVPMMLWMPGASMPSFMELSVASVAIYWVQLTAETAVMTLLFLRTKGSVLIAVLAHLAFNTAESVVFAGLGKISDDQERAIYLVNVGVLAAIGVASLLWSRRPQLASSAS